MNHELPLISAEALIGAMARPLSPALLDCSFELADPAAGERSYSEAHIPGAQYVDLDRDLSAPKTGKNGRHPLRERTQYAAWMGCLGIEPGRSVVVYDRQAAMYAVRAWWVLRWMGHPQVSVLDGGLAAWQRAGGAVTADLPAVKPAMPYPMRVPSAPTLDADQLQAKLGEVLVIDARAPERFRGEVEPLDAVAGHIPGAVNRCFKDNLQPDGRFKPPGQLRAEFESLVKDQPIKAVVHQCGSGVTACHNLLAMEVAGMQGASLYPGSWSEWSSNPTRPMARA